MVKKDKKWDWIGKQEEIFRKLNERFIRELVLVVLDLDKKMQIEVDVSDYVTKGVLSMEYRDRL